MDALKWFPLERLNELESRIAELATRGDPFERRNALAMALGLHGLRVGEVIQAKNADLHEPTKMLSVATIKGGRPRKVPLDQSLIDALRAWQTGAGASASPKAPILSNRHGRRCRREQFERMARRVTSELGASLPFHSMRHTFAMRLYAATKDLFLVQRMLGHRSVKSTEVYACSLEDVPEACLVRLLPHSGGASEPAVLDWSI